MSILLPLMTKQYSEVDFTRMAMDSRVVFTRSTSGSYWDAAGVLRYASINVPRIDHDPLTGMVRGILIENDRTNVIDRSQEFDNAWWTKNKTTVTANAITAPDGTLTADKLVEDNTNGIHYIASASEGLTANTVYTMSVFVKAGERSIFQISGAANAWGSYTVTTFNLSTKSVTSNGFTTAAIEELKDGWFRCWVSGTAAATVTSGQYFQLVLIASGTTQTYTGDGTSGMYFWGAQVESGGAAISGRAYPTSYIPTAGSNVLRSRDNCSVPQSSVGYNSSQSTAYIEFITRQSSSPNTKMILAVGTNGRFLYTGSSLYAAVYDGTTSLNCSPSAMVPYAISKVASSFGPAGLLICKDGSTVNTSAYDGDFAGTTLGIGNLSNSNHMDGWVRKVRIYPIQLPASEHKRITA